MFLGDTGNDDTFSCTSLIVWKLLTTVRHSMFAGYNSQGRRKALAGYGRHRMVVVVLCGGRIG